MRRNNDNARVKVFRLILSSCLCITVANIILPVLAYSDDKTSFLTSGTVSTGNGIYDIFVQDIRGQGVGIFTMRTGASHSVPFKNLLYGGESSSPGTSFTTIRSYTTQTDYVQTTFSPSSPFRVVSLDRFGVVKPLSLVELINNGFTTEYNLPGLPDTPDKLLISQTIKISGSTLSNSRVEVTTIVQNLSFAPVQIGIRYLWDFEIGGDDGPTFVQRQPDGLILTHEESFTSPAFRFYQVQDNDFDDPTSPIYTEQGSVFNPESPLFIPTSPDLLQYVAWPRAFPTAFNYTTDPTLDIATFAAPFRGFAGGDSAVLYFFGPTEEKALTVFPSFSVGATATIGAAPPPPSVNKANQCALDAGQECLLSAASLLLEVSALPPLVVAGVVIDIGLAANGICEAAVSFKEGRKADFVAGTLLTSTDIITLVKKVNPALEGIIDLVECTQGVTSDLCGGTAEIPECIVNALNGFVQTIQETVLAAIVGSPVDIEIIDEKGNHISLNSRGDVDSTIPQGWLYQVGNHTKMIIINNPVGTFQIKVKGGSDASPGSTFDLAILQRVELNSIHPYTTIFYEKIPTQPSSIASVEISGSTVKYDLQIDVNGDGKVDITRPPTNISQCIGDINRDGKTNITDINLVRSAIGSMCGHATYNPLNDINGDCIVDDRDLSFIEENFGCPLFNNPPIARCQNMTVPTAPRVCTASASVDNGSFDPDGDPITLVQTPAGPYGLGSSNVTLTVTDNKGASNSCSATVTVQDRTPPLISSVTASPNMLWPPDHRMVPVTVGVSASDNCGAAIVCKITTVSSNEPVDGLGDGDLAPDWQVTGNLTANLRAERSGTGKGRVYTLTAQCTDASNNNSTKSVTVAVPHDLAQN